MAARFKKAQTKKDPKEPPRSPAAPKKKGVAKKMGPTPASGVSTGRGGKITIKSVAERAGVSIATVSFVLNKRPGQVISEPVKKKVWDAAKELNYAPSAAAATLARKQTKNVAIVFYRNDHLITNQFYSFVVQGAIKEAAEKEYNIMFAFMHDEYKEYSDLPKVIREKNAEGVLFIQQVSEKLICELRKMGVSAVGVDSHPEVESLDSIYVDNKRGASLACQHLVDAGHQQIVMLTARSNVNSLEDRKTGFLRTLKKNSLDASSRNAVIKADSFDFHSAHKKTRELLKERPDVSAIFCANDEMAAGALRAAHEMGRSVPDNLSVVGFDDIIMAHYTDPPLTTVGFDKEAMGRKAMSRLLELVDDKDAAAVKQILSVDLVERSSTGQA